MSSPIPIGLSSILIHDIAHAREMILREGAAVYRLNISTAARNAAVEKTSFYANTNDMFVEKISEPSLAQKLEPKKISKQRVPMAAQGFINADSFSDQWKPRCWKHIGCNLSMQNQAPYKSASTVSKVKT